jgi:hypothetical protein
MSQHLLIFNVVSDYMPPESLAKVAKCSKAAEQAITPQLEKKMQSAKEVRQLVLRLFPTMMNLPSVAEMENKTQHYRTILNKYFDPNPNTEPCESQVSNMVGEIATKPHPAMYRFGFMLFVEGVDTAVGRRRVLKAINDWITYLCRRQANGFHSKGGVERLDALAYDILTDFTMLENRIESDIRARHMYLR